MTYKVIIEALAERDALEYATYICTERQNPVAASRWINELEKAINELAELPRRFRIVAEQATFPVEVRQFIYHSHRVIFHVNDATATVHVLRVYHSRREALLLADETGDETRS